MNEWLTPMDIYCERTDASFWAEPLNAWTNLAFIAAALYGLWLAGSLGRLSLQNAVLIGLAALIGVGSFLFHTFANRWSDLADTIPIWTFVVIYVLFALRAYFRLPWPRVARNMAFVIAILGLALYLMPSSVDLNATWLNGSEQYAPAVGALILFAYTLAHVRHPAAIYMWLALPVFLVSLVFRTLDNVLCSQIPIGTHFGWHLFNGLLIGILLAAIVRHGTGLAPETADRSKRLV
ncbi:MAG: ceramidase domain-containing protein [Hyphomicrobiaceae bacterium]|nr:ceramidase domain-containing protein [Hyphomicrobiaceae bacterium]